MSDEVISPKFAHPRQRRYEVSVDPFAQCAWCGLEYRLHDDPDREPCDRFEEWQWATHSHAARVGLYPADTECRCGCSYDLHHPDAVHGSCLRIWNHDTKPDHPNAQQDSNGWYVLCDCRAFHPTDQPRTPTSPEIEGHEPVAMIVHDPEVVNETGPSDLPGPEHPTNTGHWAD